VSSPVLLPTEPQEARRSKVGRPPLFSAKKGVLRTNVLVGSTETVVAVLLCSVDGVIPVRLGLHSRTSYVMIV